MVVQGLGVFLAYVKTQFNFGTLAVFPTFAEFKTRFDTGGPLGSLD